MEKDRLYYTVKNKICERIYKGQYRDGETIPPERTLSESFRASRVTVRKALRLLEQDGILERVQGSGNIIKLPVAGYKGTMDIIAVVAPAQNPFFSSFIDHFQKNAEKNDSLVLFKQSPPGENVEDGLFKLFQKNIRNVVVWLEDLQIDVEYIRRLRGLGMNMVFFDIVVPSPYADGVLLDNENAIKALYDFLKKQGARNIGYVGWNNENISSIYERKRVFLDVSGNEKVLYEIPWEEKASLPVLAGQFAERLTREKHASDGIICGDGEIGVAVKKGCVSQGIEGIEITSIDDYPEASSLSMSVYRQDFERFAEKTYQCLVQQNQGDWVASVYRIKGKFIERT